MRDWIYVDDHVSALYQIAKRGNAKESYTIGGNSERTNIEVVHSICDILQEKLKPEGDFKFRSLLEHVTDRPGHDYRYAINSKKIARDFAWSPTESFQTGLAKTVDWYLKNQEWCENVSNE